MRIKKIRIRNFRKLQDVRIDIQPENTVFIGANNSGKTSAMTALRYFLKNNENNSFCIYDFTLSNHQRIRDIGQKLKNETDDAPEPRDSSFWKEISPSLDLWFDVGNDDIHYVSHILPTLDWEGGSLGIRLQYEPKDIAEFYSAYKSDLTRVAELTQEATSDITLGNIDLFPKDLIDFLDRYLKKCFVIRFYALDPKKENEDQNITDTVIDENPLTGLIRIDEINAQRDVNDEDSSAVDKRKLSQQLTEYYNTHLNPEKNPTKDDLHALQALYDAQKSFGKQINDAFTPALGELKTLGYPGFYNPNIKINPQINATEGIDHSSALQYEVDGCQGSYLPESYNGLGYQNLIFMAFKLIRFRDAWLKIGKDNTIQSSEAGIEYPPIHLVLIEEPEAHLHPQAQQVFIKQAYSILTNNNDTKISDLKTQLIITTHSSHITHECEFADLRYFKRIPASIGEIQQSKVENLSDTFGSDDETKEFVSRYIKLTHCDLFFADASILIEGDAERILLPHFLQRFPCLKQSYISLLNIGGSHAHRLKPLLEKLGIPTLIITDLDATDTNGKAVSVLRSQNQTTSNPTLKNWFPQKKYIDDLLDLPNNKREQIEPFSLRVAFQTPIEVGNKEILPYTFEDSLIFTNKVLLNALENPSKMLLKAKEIENTENAFDTIRQSSFKKAEFALDLLCLKNFDEIQIPTYISDGLDWLQNILQKKLSSSAVSKETPKNE